MVSTTTSCLSGYKRVIALTAVCLSILFSVQSILTAEEVSTPSDAEQPASPNAIERAQKMMAEWEEKQKEKALHESPTQKQFRKVVSLWEKDETKDFADFAKQMIDVAVLKPNDAGARDALLWIISRNTRVADNHTEIKQRAVRMLLDDHVNDPEVARSTLAFHIASTEREALMEGLVSKATAQETLGLAKIALAKYLMSRADLSEHVQSGHGNEDVLKRVYRVYGEEYVMSLHSMDLAGIRERAVQLLEEVSNKYDDIPFVRSGRMGVFDLERNKSLGQTSQYMLDEIRNLAIGKAAPEIDGVDINGHPLSLSEHRGKVVVLVFWASWCGPCMAAIPHELELIEQFSGMPFMLLGVNCDVDKETAQKSVETAQISWPNWCDGMPMPIKGPIVDRYHVNGIPAVFVLDAKGTIRAKGLRGESLEKKVRELMNDLEPASEKSIETAKIPSASPKR